MLMGQLIVALFCPEYLVTEALAAAAGPRFAPALTKLPVRAPFGVEVSLKVCATGCSFTTT